MPDQRSTQEYKQWRADVKRRDGNACRICGADFSPHVHHIKPLAKYPDLAVNIDNGITLCGNHHVIWNGKEDSTNLQIVIETATGRSDVQTAEQLKRLNRTLCHNLINRLKLGHKETTLAAGFQLLHHLNIYPDSVEQFLPFIKLLLNEKTFDGSFPQQIVVAFLEYTTLSGTSTILLEHHRRIEIEKHRRHAQSQDRVEQEDEVFQWYIRGWSYANGRGVTQDDKKAVKWYSKAAEQNHAIALYDLGWLYANGRGVTQNPGRAVILFRKAAEQGYADAQHTLGTIYQYGKIAEKYTSIQNYHEAVKWYSKAAEQGHLEAQDCLPVVKRRLMNLSE